MLNSKNEIMLDDLALFVAIVDSGSLSAAARRMDVPAATLTRRLQQLEQRLGYQLLHRSARRLQPTAEGQEYYDRCSPLLQALQQATENLEQSRTQVQGLVRVLAPINLAKNLLAPVWRDFLQRYPQVQLDLRLSNLREDVIAQGADLAIRVGALDDSSMTSRGLGHAAIGLMAAPAYVARAPAIAHPDDLQRHDWVVAAPLRQIRLTHRETGERYNQPLWGPALRGMVNDVELAGELASAGNGLLYAPLWACAPQLERGELVLVLPQWKADAHEISLVWPQRNVPARVRALIDLLLAFAQSDPRLQGQIPAPNADNRNL